MSWNLVAILVFLLPPIITGLALASMQSRMSVRRRCTLAFWCSVFFYIAVTLGPYVVAGQYKDGVARAVLGFFWLFLPLSFLAVAVCRLVMWIAGRKRGYGIRTSRGDS